MNKLYVDFHVIQTVPPSCINRDDEGRPKTAFYGGVTRARISSQAWKHAIRTEFKKLFSDDELGFRTKNANQLIASYLDGDEKKGTEALSKAGIKSKDVLFFISTKQAKGLANLILNGEKESVKYKKVLQQNPSIDMALFGRMVAEDVELNIDAACQVAHAISTHAVQTEYDYFTALDDLSSENSQFAGHLGTSEFYSSTFYRYATVNIKDLINSLGYNIQTMLKGILIESEIESFTIKDVA